MNGLRAFLSSHGMKNIKPALYGWFFNALFSLSVYICFYIVFSNAAGTSVIAATAPEPLGLFTFLADILSNYDGNLLLISMLALLMGIFYIGFSVFTAGGVYLVWLEEEKPTFSNLISASAENFSEILSVFFMYMLICLVGLAVPGILFFLFYFSLLIEFASFWQMVTVYFSLAIAALLFVVLVLVYDFARIFKLKYGKNSLYCINMASRYVFSNKLNLSVILFMYMFAVLALYFIVNLLHGFINRLWYAVLIFAVYQGFMIIRYYLKVVLMRAEIFLLNQKED